MKSYVCLSHQQFLSACSAKFCTRYCSESIQIRCVCPLRLPLLAAYYRNTVIEVPVKNQRKSPFIFLGKDCGRLHGVSGVWGESWEVTERKGILRQSVSWKTRHMRGVCSRNRELSAALEWEQLVAAGKACVLSFSFIPQAVGY